jgi:hypothetical protein
MLKILLIITAVSLQACAAVHGELSRDPRDAAWDPRPGQQLFDQIPAWDGAANKICCGHLRQCQPHQSPRC